MPLESFSIGKVIGKGSYGEVYLVKHRKDRKQYVMKKVDLSKASARERKAAELEAKLLSQLRHPNIVSYRESFQDGAGFLYIVMNYCEGGDLYSRLKARAKEGNPLEETQVVEWFVQIAMALQYIHEKNILHRDLKTQNIFLTKSKIIKVGDLGIARVLDTSSDMATTLIGTPYYMSPELFSNKPYNHKSDVWALGCCLYEMCTLRHAFNAKDMSSLVYKILKGKVPPLPSVYSSDLCAIVRSMLELEPEKRPSASRLLRHNYIKKQIALFLEGTKKKQEQKKEEKGSSARRREKRMDSSKSDSGYVGSGPEASIVTVSAVECLIDDKKPPVKSSRSSASRDDQQRSSTESSCSSSGSSGKGESVVNNRGSDLQNKVDSEERERAKVNFKKQMPERRKSSSEKLENQIAERQNIQREGVAARRKAENERNAMEQKRPLPSVSKIRAAREQKTYQPQRPLPNPPTRTPAGNDLPASRSPRARRRYKVTSSSHTRSHAVEEEEDEEEDEEDSVADSDTSSKSVSERTPQSGLSARERRRQREKAVGSAIVIPQSFQGLPSPNEVIAAKVKRSQESVAAPSPEQWQAARKPGRQPSSVDCDVTDGARPVARQVSTAVPVDQDSGSNSELEEISVDEPVPSSQREPRRQSDVSSLICALDTTLRLSDVSNDRESPDVETAPEIAEEPLDVPYGASPSTSGRLRDRIDRLKRECIRGIGEDLLSKASHIIDTREEDVVEEALVRLMGRENFEKYGGPIWQLKFCESFRVN